MANSPAGSKSGAASGGPADITFEQSVCLGFPAAGIAPASSDGERLLRLLATGGLRIKGRPSLLVAFGKCFPS
jgi:hypothetical protein